MIHFTLLCCVRVSIHKLLIPNEFVNFLENFVICSIKNIMCIYVSIYTVIYTYTYLPFLLHYGSYNCVTYYNPHLFLILVTMRPTVGESSFCLSSKKRSWFKRNNHQTWVLHNHQIRGVKSEVLRLKIFWIQIYVRIVVYLK